MKLIAFDWAIKGILRNKANFGILEGFLTELLKFDVKIQTILESESNQFSESDKFNKVDLLCENTNKELILIELQYNQELDYLLRMLYGVSKLICESVEKGMSYGEIKKVYSINIVYFDLGTGDDYVYYGSTRFIGLHTQHELELKPKHIDTFKTETIAKLYPEYYILKIKAFPDELRDSLDEWIYLFKHDEIQPNFKAKGILEAADKLKNYQMDKDEKYRYDNFVKAERSKISQMWTARIEGEEIGKKQKQIEIANKMKTEGLSIELISKLTGLNISELNDFS